MGVFGAVFGCRGDGGFNGCCLGASIGDGGFNGRCLGASSGDGGFNAAMLLRLMREKVRPAWSDGGREREIVRPARSKHPKIGVFTLAGRVFSRQSALCPGLVGDVAHEAGCGGGFAALEAGWRRVAGVSYL